MQKTYDVVVAGGGAAGLSTALVLARARRSVLVVDAGAPRNAPSAGVHNYLGREGSSPSALLATGRDEVRSYGGEVEAGTVTGIDPTGDGFVVRLDDGQEVGARRLVVATGLVDELPAVDGVAERWGRDVLHCPYCHGHEVRDQALAVLATGPFAAHVAQLFRQWSADVTLLVHTEAPPSAEVREQLDARGIRVVEGVVKALEVADDRVVGVRLSDDAVVPVEAVVVTPRMTARADLVAPLGLLPVPLEMDGHVVGTQLPADPTGATTVPGLWVVGNAVDVRAGVVNAAAAGMLTAAALNADLVADDVRRAVADHRG